MHVPAGENMWTSYACTNRLEHVDVLCNKDGEKTQTACLLLLYGAFNLYPFLFQL